MQDERIIALFFKRDEQGIRECMTAYGQYCRGVAARILPDPEDVEEAVADTWLAAWKTIPPQKPKSLRLYLGRITRNAAVDIWRRKAAYSRGGGETTLALEELGECVSNTASPEMQYNEKELSALITAFLKQQSVACRQVFLRRYFYLEDIATIAQACGRRQSSVRMMLCRVRQKLKKYLIQEGYDL